MPGYFVLNIQDLMNIIITNNNIPPQIKIIMVAPRGSDIYLFINVFREVNISCLVHNLGLIVVKHYQQHYMTIPFIFLLSAVLLSKLFYPRKFQSSVHLSCFNELQASAQGFSAYTPYISVV